MADVGREQRWRTSATLSAGSPKTGLICAVLLTKQNRVGSLSRSSRGLGHRPFTAATRVRISYGMPAYNPTIDSKTALGLSWRGIGGIFCFSPIFILATKLLYRGESDVLQMFRSHASSFMNKRANHHPICWHACLNFVSVLLPVEKPYSPNKTGHPLN